MPGRDVKGIDVIVKKSYNGPPFVSIKIGIVTTDGAMLSMEVKKDLATVAGKTGNASTGLMAKIARITLKVVNGYLSTTGLRAAVRELRPPAKPVAGIDVVTKPQPTEGIGFEAAVIVATATAHSGDKAKVQCSTFGEITTTVPQCFNSNDFAIAGDLLWHFFCSGVPKAKIEECVKILL